MNPKAARTEQPRPGASSKPEMVLWTVEARGGFKIQLKEGGWSHILTEHGAEIGDHDRFQDRMKEILELPLAYGLVESDDKEQRRGHVTRLYMHCNGQANCIENMIAIFVVFPWDDRGIVKTAYPRDKMYSRWVNLEEDYTRGSDYPCGRGTPEITRLLNNIRGRRT